MHERFESAFDRDLAADLEAPEKVVRRVVDVGLTANRRGHRRAGVIALALGVTLGAGALSTLDRSSSGQTAEGATIQPTVHSTAHSTVSSTPSSSVRIVSVGEAVAVSGGGRPAIIHTGRTHSREREAGSLLIVRGAR